MGLSRPEYCGMFRAPTLRNVATRQSYFHNGVFHSLREVLDFYATRDTDPQRWWGRGKARYDDLPARFHGNVNQDPPFKPLPNGQPGPNLYCAVIVKRVDEKTRSKTSINELLRD